MDAEFIAIKRHYDITMSKRTRKKSVVQEPNARNSTTKDLSSPVCTHMYENAEVSDNERRSLQQLITGDGKVNSESVEECKGRNTLGQHFNEERHLQLVRKGDGLQGLKLQKLFCRFAKVLGHLIKVKREQHKGELQSKSGKKMTIT